MAGNNLINRRAQFMQMLQSVGVLSAPLVRRHFGFDLRDFENVLPVFELEVTPIYGRATSTRRVLFVARARNVVRKLSPSQVGHVVGTGAMLLALGARPGQFSSDAAALGRGAKPDALLRHPKFGVIAIEYDTGSYGLARRRSKLEAFREGNYKGLVWGTSNPARADKLLRPWLQPLNAKVLTVDWWSDVAR